MVPKSSEIFPEFQLLKDVLNKRGSMVVEGVGNSMAPLLMAGDKLTVVPLLDTEEPRRFEIFVYLGEHGLVAHYFLKSNQLVPMGEQEKIYCFRGLANKTDDFPVKRNQLLGRVTGKNLTLIHKFSIFWSLFRERFT